MLLYIFESSLLSSILRETRRVSGTMIVNGRLAYASQDAWIFSGSIRDNILFGEPYDEKRYQEAIRVCALNKVSFIVSLFFLLV